MHRVINDIITHLKYYCQQKFNVDRHLQSEMQKEKKLYSSEQFANWGNTASHGNQKCALQRQKVG